MRAFLFLHLSLAAGAAAPSPHARVSIRHRRYSRPSSKKSTPDPLIDVPYGTFGGGVDDRGTSITTEPDPRPSCDGFRLTPDGLTVALKSGLSPAAACLDPATDLDPLIASTCAARIAAL